MKFIKYFLVLTFVFLQDSAFSQVEKYMAAFTYQICKSTTWPTHSGDFVIAMVGKSDITPFFEQLSKEKNIAGSSIKIIEWKKSNEVMDCNVIFISKDETTRLPQIISELENKPVLIITESSGTIKNGANLSFKIIDNKIRYNINKSDLQNRNLSVQSNIERMALKVY